MSPQELAEVETTKPCPPQQDNLQVKRRCRKLSHVGDTDTALEELQRLILKKNGVIMATKQKK